MARWYGMTQADFLEWLILRAEREAKRFYPKNLAAIGRDIIADQKRRKHD